MSGKDKTEVGEQMPLIDVTPENIKTILPAAKEYQKAKTSRMKATDKEVAAKNKLLGLVKNAKIKPLDDGTIRFRCENFTISITPRDELIKVKETDE